MFKEKSTRKVHLNQNNVPGLSEPIIRDLFKPLPWQVFEPVHQQSDYQNLETRIEKGPAHERLLFAQICTGECLISFPEFKPKGRSYPALPEIEGPRCNSWILFVISQARPANHQKRSALPKGTPQFQFFGSFGPCWETALQDVKIR